jgi:hypothetical protein
MFRRPSGLKIAWEKNSSAPVLEFVRGWPVVWSPKSQLQRKRRNAVARGTQARNAFPATQSYPAGLLSRMKPSLRPAKPFFVPREVILKQVSTSMHRGSKRRGFPAMKKRQDIITSMLSRWALHLMAIAYAGCEIFSRS